MFFKGEYPYRSGVTATMREALQDVAESASKAANLRRGDVVISIGCNDGTELTYYSDDLVKIGFEPGPNLVVEARANNPEAVIVNDYWSYKDYAQVSGRKAKVIQAIACMYSVPEINPFLADVRKAIAETGVFIAQMTGLKHTLANNDIGNLTNEHQCFYSLEPLSKLLANHGLYLFDYQENLVNGGSLRIYASPTKLPESPALHLAKAEERAAGFRTQGPYSAFTANCAGIRDQVKAWVAAEEAPCGYAASTKGNLLLQYWSLDRSSLFAIAERDPRKYGKETGGSRIPILDEGSCRKRASGFLVLAPAFRGEMLAREASFLAKGGKMAFTQPNFEVIANETLV